MVNFHKTDEHPSELYLAHKMAYNSWSRGVGDHDITEFDITESDVTFFQEFDITESDITEKGNFYNGIRYNGICYNMKLEIGITKFVTVESDITGKWKLI